MAATLMVCCAILPLWSAQGAGASFSPYSLRPKQDVLLLGTGAALLGSAWLIDQQVQPLSAAKIVNSSPGDVNWFDRSATGNWSPAAATASDILLTTTSSLPFVLLAAAEPRRDIVSLAVMFLEVGALNNGLTSLVKPLVARPRPFTYNDAVAQPVKLQKDAARSFYSGHTSGAFSSAVFFATVFSDYYPQSRWKLPVWAASLSLASTTGILRYAAGKHFPTDIITGAVMGSAIGYLVPRLHRSGAMQIGLIPSPDGGGVVARVSW